MDKNIIKETMRSLVRHHDRLHRPLPCVWCVVIFRIPFVDQHFSGRQNRRLAACFSKEL